MLSRISRGRSRMLRTLSSAFGEGVQSELISFSKAMCWRTRIRLPGRLQPMDVVRGRLLLATTSAQQLLIILSVGMSRRLVLLKTLRRLELAFKSAEL